MRQVSPATNLVLACLSALGLAASLNLPWYAPYVADTNEWDGPVERAGTAVGNVFAHHDHAVTGADALGHAQSAILLLAAAIVVLSALAAVPALRRHVRDVLRGVALVTPVVVAYLLIDRPDKLVIHWGVLAALALALFTASAAWHGSEVRVRRPAPGSWQRRPA
jgi:hypothetical protein